MSRVTVSLPEGLLAEIDAEVRHRGTSRSAFLAAAASRELTRPSPAVVRQAIERSERRFAGAGAFEAGDLVRAERDVAAR